MNKFEVIKYTEQYFNQTADLISLFRNHLRKFKDINSEPDINDAKKEFFYI